MDFHPYLYDRKTHELRQDLRKAGWFWDNYGDDDSRFIFENEGPLKNVWIGVSVEDQKNADERIPLLLQIPAAVRFLSCEPLLGPIDLAVATTWPPDKCPYCNFIGRGYLVEGGRMCPECSSYMDRMPMIDWVIVGGESGHKARPMHPDWARSIRDECKVAGVPFFFKQWGSWVTFEQMPKELQLALRRGETTHKIENLESNNGLIYTMHNVGKHAAGNVLDGETHLNYP
jgi:hypothetical protein